MCKQNPGLFLRMGDKVHQLATARLEFWMVSSRHAERCGRFSVELAGSRRSQDQNALAPRVETGCQESLSKQQQKALSCFFLIMSLSKYLIIVENKLHVTEIILWGNINLLGSCL